MLTTILTGLSAMKRSSGIRLSMSDRALLAEGGSTGGAGWIKWCGIPGVRRAVAAPGGRVGRNPGTGGVGRRGFGNYIKRQAQFSYTF